MSLCRKILTGGLAALAAATALLAVPAYAATTAQPLNVVALGDSYASGEGDIGSGWIDSACQRSAGAASERAAHQLNGIRPVNFTSFACAGSVIDPAEVPGSPALLGPNGQLSKVDPAGGTPVDALTISIGGNDIGFDNIVKACMSPGNSCSTDPNVTGPLASALNALPGHLGDLIKAINGRPDINNVFLTAYPDGTTGPPPSGGSPVRCGVGGPDPGFEGFDFITEPDAAWASTSVIAPLNAALQAAVTTANSQSGHHAVWHFVSGIASAFSGHGFCTGVGAPLVSALWTWPTPRYIATPADSLTSQLDANGSMHPNDLGQQVIADVIYNGYQSLPLMSASASASALLIAGDPASFTVQALTFANTPIAAASVLVDGNLVGHTDGSGILNVSGYVFPAAGNHTIVTQAAGYPDARAVLAVQTKQLLNVIANADGRLEVFGVGTGNALGHTVQSVPGSWSGSGWAPLGPGSAITSEPVAARNADGTLDVFARGTDNALWHLRQSAPGSWSGSGWAPLGPGSAITSEPVAARNADGTLDVFARGTDNALWHLRQSAPGSWSGSGWAPLGPGSAITSDPQVGTNADGTLDVFARGTDNALWHLRQTAPGSWSGSGWAPLGPGSAITSEPVAARNADGTLDVFARGTDNALWHLRQSAPGSWSGSGWAPLGPGSAITSDPQVGTNADGTLDVFARGTDNALWHLRQTAPGSWSGSGWAPLGPGSAITSDPQVGTNADGTLDVFARGTDNALWHLRQTAPGSWSGSGWAPLGGSIPG